MSRGAASRDHDVPIPFAACNLSGRFVFVSYAHLDKVVVYPELSRIRSLGVQVWYDEGIEPGGEWPEEIATALMKAAAVVVMITPNAVVSRNVRNEINFALGRGKSIQMIYLAETQLPLGLELQIGTIQAIMRWRMDGDSYARKLANALAPYAGPEISAVKPPAFITMERPILIEVSEEPTRRNELLGREARHFDNTNSSAAMERTLNVSRTWVPSAFVDLNQARAISGGGEVEFRDVPKAQEDLQNALADHYSGLIGAEQVFETSISVFVPAHVNAKQTIYWRLIWATGMANLAESARPTSPIAQVPYKISVGLTLDQEVKDLESRAHRGHKSTKNGPNR
jgi:TIR domain